MTIRVAAIEVSHWHALNDAAYLRHLVAMPDVELVAIQDSDAGLVARRAAEVGSPPTFTDYRKMLATTRPDLVVALSSWHRAPLVRHVALRAVPIPTHHVGFTGFLFNAVRRSGATGSSYLEIIRPADVGDQADLSRLPSQPLLRERA
jgi:hypothetical protein